MRSLLTLGLLGLFGCATAPEVKNAPTTSLLVALERGACFGACPIYRVEVFTDGRVRFQGERFVQVTEPVEAKLSEAQLQALTARLERGGFAWKSYERRDATDMPTVVLTWKGQTLRHYQGDQSAPPELTQLEDDLDALIGTARWIKGEAADR